MATQTRSRFCGETRTEPVRYGRWIVRYRYVIVNGCGNYSRPEAKHCETCGKEFK